MKNHALLDMIGEVNEAYILAADQPARRPRPRWTVWTAAACAALMVAAYPVYQAIRPPALHGYTVVEGGASEYRTEQSDVKSPQQGGAEHAPTSDVPSNSGGGEASVEEGPYTQYNSLFENARLDQYPDWYGGCYNDYSDSGVPAKLVVCIVERLRTPALEQQITDWCGGGEIVFRDVKYSRGFLQELMEQLNGSQFLSVMEADRAISGWGVYEEENCILMDCRDIPSDAALAALAQLDPEGDAILVRVHTGPAVSTDIAKSSNLGGSQPSDDPVGPVEEPIAVEPEMEDLPQARYDTLPLPLPLDE